LKKSLKKANIGGLMDLHKNETHAWQKGMTINPTPGTAYIISGHLEDLKSINYADGIKWSNKTKAQAGNYIQKRFYYTAVPDFKNMDVETKAAKFSLSKYQSQISLKAVTFRKVVIYDSERSAFIVEYLGDSCQYPWQRTSQLPVVKTGKQTQEAQDGFQDFKNILALEVNDNGEKPKFIAGIPFMTANINEKIDNIISIDAMLKCEKSTLGKKLLRAEKTQVVNPEGGDCFLFDLSNATTWKGRFHGDGLSWKQFRVNDHKNCSMISQYFYLRKNSVTHTEFLKETHYNVTTKILFVHYYGNPEASRKQTSHGNRVHGDIPYFPTSGLVKVKRFYKIKK